MMGLLVGGLLVASLAGAGSGEGYLVVTPPGWTMAQTTSVVRASGGRLVRPGGFSNVVIAASADPQFDHSLKAAGALLARRVPGPLGCVAPRQGGKAR